jgi:hypothetical protein
MVFETIPVSIAQELWNTLYFYDFILRRTSSFIQVCSYMPWFYNIRTIYFTLTSYFFINIKPFLLKEISLRFLVSEHFNNNINNTKIVSLCTY